MNINPVHTSFCFCHIFREWGHFQDLCPGCAEGEYWGTVAEYQSGNCCEPLQLASTTQAQTEHTHTPQTKREKQQQTPLILSTNNFRTSTAPLQILKNRSCACWRNYSLWVICSTDKLLSLHVLVGGESLPLHQASVRPHSAMSPESPQNFQQHWDEKASSA